MGKSKRGKVGYLPFSLIDEVEDIKQEEGLKGFGSSSVAMNKLVKYAEVGREARRIMRLDFSHRKRKR